MRMFSKLLMFFSLSVILLNLTTASSYLMIQGPVNATIYTNSTLYLGNVGPGQSFYVKANANTTNSSGYHINIGWSTLKATSLPANWSSQPSPLYENPMKMKINVASNAQNGTYLVTLTAENVGNYSKLGSLTFHAYVNVTPNVFNLNVTPNVLKTGIDQPSNLYISINNTGISDDPFIISASGLPAWNVSSQVISLHGKQNTFIYPVFLSEPGVYNFNLTVQSVSTSLIKKSYPIKLIVNESLVNDYNAVGSGAVLSPVIFAPAYSLISLVTYLYQIITGH